MKDVFEEIRADKDFNLESLTYQEIFDGIKIGVALAISKFSKEDVKEEDLKLNIGRCSTRSAYGEDQNLYPKIYLDLKGCYSVLLTPFEIDLIEIKQRLRTVSCVELKECFYNFMCEKFPTSNYDKKFEKYFLDAEKLRKIDFMYQNY